MIGEGRDFGLLKINTKKSKGCIPGETKVSIWPIIPVMKLRNQSAPAKVYDRCGSSCRFKKLLRRERVRISRCIV